MAAARVAVVPGLVSRDADERILRRLEFDGAAGAKDVLVVVALASRQVPAETGVGETSSGDTYAQRVGERRGRTADQIELTMRTHVGAKVEMRPVGTDAPGDIFDCAADRVAAVEGAL